MTQELYKLPNNEFVPSKREGALLWGNITDSSITGKKNLNILMFKSDYHFDFADDFWYSYDNSKIESTIQIKVKTKNNPSDEAYITYKSNSIFGRGGKYFDEIVCRFFTALSRFDSAKDDNLIFSLEDPLSYKNPEVLMGLVSDVVSALFKYQGRESFTFAPDIAKWLKIALSRFGYTMRVFKKESIDDKFANITENLNKLGFILDN